MNKKLDIHELLEELTDDRGGESSSFIKSATQRATAHNVYFDEPIAEPSKYRTLINLMYTADENTEFNFLINNPGGFLNTTLAIVEAINATDATVRAIIVGECMSAASMLALSCHEVVVLDSAHMMIHTAGYSTAGNVNMVQNHVEFTSKYVEKILDKVYMGFLSPDEITEVKKGVELWLDADEIRERLQNKITLLKEKQEQEVAEVEEETPEPVKTRKKASKTT